MVGLFPVILDDRFTVISLLFDFMSTFDVAPPSSGPPSTLDSSY